MLREMKKVLKSIEGTVTEDILEILFSGEFVDSQECVNEGEQILGVLPDYEKALRSLCSKYSLEGRT